MGFLHPRWLALGFLKHQQEGFFFGGLLGVIIPKNNEILIMICTQVRQGNRDPYSGLL